MRKLLLPILMALTAIAMPQAMKADEPSKPERPNPSSMFKRLDANKDGVITADELPASMPERLKQMLKKADKNGDSQITLEEMLQGVKDRRPEGKLENRPEGKPEKHQANKPDKHPEGKPEMRPEGKPPKGPQGPNPEVMFQRLDANKDGKVTTEEIPEGMPERMKQMVIKADKNGDKELTLAELKKAIKPRQEAGKQPKQAPPTGPNKDRPNFEKAFSGHAKPTQGKGRPPMGLVQHSVKAIHGNLPKLPNLKVVFERLDTDKNGTLNFDEFKAGMMKFHQMFASRPMAPPTPQKQIAGKHSDWEPKQWPSKHHADWKNFAGRPGPQHSGKGNGWDSKSCPLCHGYAMNSFPKHSNRPNGQYHGYSGHHGQPGPHFQDRPGPNHDRPSFEGRGMGYGPHFDHSWSD